MIRQRNVQGAHQGRPAHRDFLLPYMRDTLVRKAVLRLPSQI